MNANLKNLETANPEDVLDVYSGKNHSCCCGCTGKYSYNSKRTVEGTKERGYAVGPEDCNDKMVAKVLKLMKADMGSVESLSPSHFTLEVGNRLYMLMLSKKAMATKKLGEALFGEGFYRPMTEAELVAQQELDSYEGLVGK